MKHKMSTPCKHCPFRKNINGYLRRERVVEIAHNVLQGGSFPCHKTTESIESDDGESDMKATGHSEECAGAAIFAAKHRASSQMSRIAERLGMKVAKLNMRAKVCSSVGEMIAVHCGEEETTGETCHVCGPHCEAPAGILFPGGGVSHGTEFIETTCDLCGEYVCDSCSRMDGSVRVCDYCKDDNDDAEELR